MRLTRYRHGRSYTMFGLLHAAKDGSPVLKGLYPWWRTVNGVYFNHRRTGWLLFEFRRVSP